MKRLPFVYMISDPKGEMVYPTLAFSEADAWERYDNIYNSLHCLSSIKYVMSAQDKGYFCCKFKLEFVDE